MMSLRWCSLERICASRPRASIGLGEAGEALGIDADREDIGPQPAALHLDPAAAQLDAASSLGQNRAKLPRSVLVWKPITS